MAKKESAAQETPQVFKMSIALQNEILNANMALLKMIDVAVQQRKIDPLAGVLIGLSDEALDEYSKIDKEDRYEVAKLGIPLFNLKISNVSDIRELAATGFSSARLVSLLSMMMDLATPKVRK